MSTKGASPSEVRASLATRLWVRCAELEGAILARVHVWTSHQSGHVDAEYIAGLQVTIPDVLEYGFLGIEQGEELPLVFPSSALVKIAYASRCDWASWSARRKVAGMKQQHLATSDHLGATVRRLRHEQGITQEALAFKASGHHCHPVPHRTRRDRPRLHHYASYLGRARDEP